MELRKITTEILERIRLLKTARQELQPRAQAKADTVSGYYRKRAVTIMALRNGKKFELDGEEIQDPPVSIIESVARGICWEEKHARDLAESMYKNAVTGIDSLKLETNALQSILRIQDEA